MAKVRREAHACTGRGFSKTDPAVFGDNSSGGLMSRIMSFATRPNAHGTPFNITSSNFPTSEFTYVGHGLSTGQSIALSGSGTIDTASFTLSTSLAFPLSRSSFTEYFVIKISNDVFQLAISHYNAMKTVPVPITFTSNISGTITVTPLGGGANWYLHDDFSRMEDVSFATTAVDVGNDTITLTGNAFSHMHKVTFSTTGTLPTGLTAGTSYWLFNTAVPGVYKIASSEANAHNLTAINLTSQGTGTHTITTAEHFVVITDTLNPVVNDYNTSPCGIAPKFLKIGYLNSESGYFRMQGLLWWNKTDHLPIQYWSGHLSSSYDSAIFTYQLIAGDEFFFVATKLGTTWYQQFVDTFTGLSSKLEAITKVGVLQGGITSGLSKVLQLASGQAANFTLNKFYYLYDFSSGSRINYIKVTAIDLGLDQVTIDGCDRNFPAGAVLTPYAHRYYAFGYRYYGNVGLVNIAGSYSGNFNDYSLTIPYCSSNTESHVSHNNQGVISLGSPISFYTDAISIGTPDDEGYYDCIKALVRESISGGDLNTGMNRVYGKTNNMLQTTRGSMDQMGSYRTLLGIDYLYFYPAPTTYVYMIRYSESAS